MAGAYQILVVGSGVMGRAIALSFARTGHATAVLSRNAASAGEIGEGVAVIDELPDEAPELIIESVPEVAELKLALYARLEAVHGGRSILASNTSGLSLPDLAAGLRHPEKFVGIHYFQPADIAPMVEIARVEATEPAVLTRADELVRASGKRTVVLHEALPGLLINRLQHALLHEAYYLIERGICTAADIDAAARHLLGPRMAVTGLIEQKDLSGLDTHALAQAAIVPYLHHEAEPSEVVQAKYRDGRIGIKTGTGFYDWREMDVPAYQKACAALLDRVLASLDGQHPAHPPLGSDDGA